VSDREFLANARRRWDRFKSGEAGLTGDALATAIALWASLNVDHLIALAERATTREGEARG
jgi:hypothetical protein